MGQLCAFHGGMRGSHITDVSAPFIHICLNFCNAVSAIKKGLIPTSLFYNQMYVFWEAVPSGDGKKEIIQIELILQAILGTL